MIESHDYENSKFKTIHDWRENNNSTVFTWISVSLFNNKFGTLTSALQMDLIPTIGMHCLFLHFILYKCVRTKNMGCTLP